MMTGEWADLGLPRNIGEGIVRKSKPASPDSEPYSAKTWREGLGQSGSCGDRILFVGDIHDKAVVLCPMIDEVADRTDAGVIVLLGDLLNEWNIKAADEIESFAKLAEWITRQREQREVVVLLGNHDLAYWAEPHTFAQQELARQCPGFNPGAYPDVHYLLHTVVCRDGMRIMYGFTDGRGCRILASHAGLTYDWWNWMPSPPSRKQSAEQDREAADVAVLVNEFANGHIGGGLSSIGAMAGPERGGWPGSIPSPVWAGKEELAHDPIPGFDQIVGHSPVPTIQCRLGGIIASPDDSARCIRRRRPRLWYCDTHSLTRSGKPIGDGSMLFYDRNSGDAWRIIRAGVEI